MQIECRIYSPQQDEDHCTLIWRKSTGAPPFQLRYVHARLEACFTFSYLIVQAKIMLGTANAERDDRMNQLLMATRPSIAALDRVVERAENRGVKIEVEDRMKDESND